MGEGKPAVRWLAALPLALVAACGSPQPEAEPSPTPTATPDKPKTLVPADLGQLVLGARIEGPDGPETSGTFTVDGETLGEVVSYVACPEGMDPCDPATAPEGTIYTYVHKVTPAEGVASATLFRTARRATGFANVIGFAKAEAADVLGEEGQIDVASDNGALVWRVIGGNGWAAGETLTFFWQSTLPPEGAREAFQFEADGTSAQGSGPFPPREVQGEVPVEGNSGQ
jgi:hypothetical protein